MHDRTIEIFTGILELRGPVAGLAYLNDRVPHRYTAIYRLDQEWLRSLYLHDKQGETLPEQLAAVRFNDSFCQFVLRDGTFRTDDSALDRRLDGHPHQGAMMSYHGVVLRTETGKMRGSMCHFDTRKLALSDENFDLLQRAASLMSRFLPVHS